MSVLTLSRREFVVASTAGLIGAVSRATRSSLNEELQRGGLPLYVGTYTQDTRSRGIYLVRMDPRSGKLRLVGAFDAGANPSFLAIHPNGRVLYAVNETTERNGKPTGGVSALAITRDTGALTRLIEQPSE